MASKLFGGANLSDIARSVKERGEASPFDKPGAARPVMPAAELALTGRPTADLQTAMRRTGSLHGPTRSLRAAAAT